MAFRARFFRAVRRLAPVLLIALAFAACGGTSEQYPQSTLHPKADFTRMIDDVFMTTVWWSVVVFVLVEGALLYVIFRYRGKPNDAEPRQVHGNTTLEIIWTAIPALILAMIAVPTVRAIFRTYEMPKGEAMLVEVTGHQWWWEFRYPEYGVVTANELHVPTGRVVTLRMKTADVLHSFWLPQLASKRDIFPDRATTLWFRADSAGYYSGQCAEFCGVQHARMGFHVAAMSPADFDGYIAGLRGTGAPVPADTTVTTLGAGTQETAADSSAIAAGERLFGMPPAGKGCPLCHTLDATSQAKMTGPNLANVGSRKYIGAGMLLNTDENLARWIFNPQLIKHGILMPPMGLTMDEARSVAAYLRTRR
jgi:cytochrome c oxidase subunit 2